MLKQNLKLFFIVFFISSIFIMCNKESVVENTESSIQNDTVSQNKIWLAEANNLMADAMRLIEEESYDSAKVPLCKLEGEYSSIRSDASKDSTAKLLKFIEWYRQKEFIDLLVNINDEDYEQLLNKNYKVYTGLFKELYNDVLYKERLNRDKYKKKEEIIYDITKEKSAHLYLKDGMRCDMKVILNRYINKEELKIVSNTIRNDGRKSYYNLCIGYFIGDMDSFCANTQYVDGKWRGFHLQAFSKDDIKDIIEKERIYWDSLTNEGYNITGKWTDGNDLIILLKKDNKLFVSMKVYSNGKLLTWGLVCELYEGRYMAPEYYVIQDDVLIHYFNNGKDSYKYTYQISGKCDKFLGKWKDGSQIFTMKKRKIITTDKYDEYSEALIPDKFNFNKFLLIVRTFKIHKDGTLSYKTKDSNYKFRKYGELETMWLD